RSTARIVRRCIRGPRHRAISRPSPRQRPAAAGGHRDGAADERDSAGRFLAAAWCRPYSLLFRQAADRYPYRGRTGMRYAFEAGERYRSAVLARAFDASISRSRGGALVTREASSSCAALATWSTARSNAGWFALEGRVKPLSFRTNCREDARISSSVAGGLKLCSVLILRHMSLLAPQVPHRPVQASGRLWTPAFAGVTISH